MEIINEGIVKNLKELNNKMVEKLGKIDGIEKSSLRKNLSNIGKFINLEKVSKEELSKFNPMACVDGSTNRYGGSFPHYIDIFQGIAKISGSENVSLFRSNINSPLINPLVEEDKGEELKDKLLAKIEVEVAIDAVKNNNIKFLLMDGNLIRYGIRVPNEFEELVRLCEEKNIVLFGFIKQAKTDSIFNLLFPDDTINNLTDKDLLYGVLDVGEGFLLPEEFNKKTFKGFSSLLLRLSNFPGVAGIEILNSQSQYLKTVGDLCYSLTSTMSRGVPYIIDIVDKEVKLDDKLTEELINSYLDKDIVERFFRSERSMRRY